MLFALCEWALLKDRVFKHPNSPYKGSILIFFCLYPDGYFQPDASGRQKDGCLNLQHPTGYEQDIWLLTML